MFQSCTLFDAGGMKSSERYFVPIAEREECAAEAGEVVAVCRGSKLRIGAIEELRCLLDPISGECDRLSACVCVVDNSRGR